MIIETYLLDILVGTKQLDKENNENKNKIYSLIILKLLIILIAIYLAWNCNAQSPILIRLLYTIIASLFSGFYILYYSIYRILLKNDCNIKNLNNFTNRFKDLTLI